MDDVTFILILYFGAPIAIMLSAIIIIVTVKWAVDRKFRDVKHLYKEQEE